MTPYEILKGRKPNLNYCHIFGSVCYILNDREQRGKLDAKSDEEVFLGYSNNSRTYWVYNKRTWTIIQSVNVVVDDFQEVVRMTPDDEILSDEGIEDQEDEKQSVEDSVTNSVATSTETGSSKTEAEAFDIADPITREPPSRIKKNHPVEEIIGSIDDGICTREKPKLNYRDMVRYVCYTSLVESKNVKEALEDEFWINAMQEELGQLERNEVWDLVPRPNNSNVIGTKWIFKNKTNELGNIIRNKARLVVQGYTQVEGVDFDDIFASVARLESIWLLLSIACLMGFKLF